ncbi:hypothetical protein GC209_01685 [bacterium]|nr:hypothetical protein [bacterium]
MTKVNSARKSMILLAATVAVGALVLGGAWTMNGGHFGTSAAFAQDEGSDGGGKGKQGGQGNGAQGAKNGQGTNDGKGKGQGGPSADSEGKGPQAGSSGNTGGKPVWAQEGIPEVELGRLNVSRSPDHVLQRAYDEALASVSPEMISFYNLPLDQKIDQLSLSFDTVAYIDSPLQNLALLKDALDGQTNLASLGVTTSAEQLEAVFLGVASDKTVPITTNTVIAVTTILGTPVTGDAAAKLAADAEAVRIAILAGHG